MNKSGGHIIPLQIKGRTLPLQGPAIMGILNTTPDSFSDGGKYQTGRNAVDRIHEMVAEGASIIDIGGESTRPGSDSVSESEEMDRVLPVLEKGLAECPDTLFSVDTTKFGVAEAALGIGAHIINDVSGLAKEPRLAGLCSKHKAGYILMHSQGDPKTMQINPVYKNVITDIQLFFEKSIKKLNNTGVKTVILDPGIGFGKTLEHNLQLIAGLDKFKKFGLPLMAGASRKSMIGKLLGNRPVEKRLAGTLAVHYHCLLRGASLLRVHDVKETMDIIRVFKAVSDL